jgi:hypothetical protein
VSASIPDRDRPEDPRTPTVSITLVDLPDSDPAAWLQLFREKFAPAWRSSGLQTDERSSYPWTSDEGQVVANGIGTETEADQFVELVKATVEQTQTGWEDALAADADSQPDTEALRNEFAEALADIRLRGLPLVTGIVVSTFRAGRGVTAPLAATVTMSLAFDGDRDMRHRFWQALNATGRLGPGRDAPLDLHDHVLRAPGTMPVESVHSALADATAAVEAELAALQESRERDETLRQAIEVAARTSASL